jgi:SAM-dependent methyltransferase
MNTLSPGRRLYLFCSQLFFSIALAPLFLWPRLAQTNLIRRLISFSFGTLLAKRYHLIIQSFGNLYGVALAQGLQRASALAGVEVRRVIDCGTGSGFASREAALHFRTAFVAGVEIITEMLDQAQANAREQGLKINYIMGDTAHLPFEDATIDLVIAQNTAPFFTEFGRVCRPRGIVVFVDTVAQWVSPLARQAANRTGCFDLVECGKASVGFYLVARRRAPGTN